MGAFLKEAAPYGEDALLADCANVEWAFIEAFDAADAPPLDVSVLASIDEDAWDRANHPFSSEPAFLSSSRHPAPSFRTPCATEKSRNDPQPETAHVVTFRAADDTLRWLDVEPAAFALLERSPAEASARRSRRGRRDRSTPRSVKRSALGSRRGRKTAGFRRSKCEVSRAATVGGRIPSPSALCFGWKLKGSARASRSLSGSPRNGSS